MSLLICQEVIYIALLYVIEYACGILPFFMGKLEGRGFSWAPILETLDRGKSKGKVPGLGGTMLKFKIGTVLPGLVSQYKIDIYDAKQPSTYYLRSTVTRNGEMRLSLRTRGSRYNRKENPSVRHPALFAAEFITDAIALYDRQWGVTPTHIIGLWSHQSGYSDNLGRFHEIYSETHDKVIAAKGTWTGREMEKNGFLDIEAHDIMLTPAASDTPWEVEAVFWRVRPPFK
jgi:hypothetical protein